MEGKDKLTGAVLVLGGGIAGMQGALDLADSGFRVYLVDSSPAIGGNMVKLDKTFPTGDCSMCTIAPRLVECARHRNIQIITLSELEKVEGSPGNFLATLKRYPRYVSEEKCNACGDCEKVCPVEIKDEFNSGLSLRKAIYKPYPQAVPNVYVIDKRGVSPCRLGCPAGVNPHGYVALLSQGKYEEALSLIREALPFAGSCGYVCTHPCEKECYRGETDEPISICALKRFLFEKVEDKPITPPPLRYPEKIAIIGGGPTGLTCAYHLRKLGYKTVVFESSSRAGGMLSLAIPDFRLPPRVVERDIKFIENSGVEIRLNTEVGKDVDFESLLQDYQAVFIACGAPHPRELLLEGAREVKEGLWYGIDFLRKVKKGEKIRVGARVGVVGGGNTALDAARMAKREGASEVFIIYRRTREEMPAIPEEVDKAIEEGIKIIFLSSPVRVKVSQGRIRSVECIRMKPGERDKDGRRKPVPIPGSEYSLPLDTLIIAIGQYSDLSFLPPEIKLTPQGFIQVDPQTYSTSLPGVFAGGDAVTGPDVLINAIGIGRRTALSIHSSLRGEKIPLSSFLPPEERRAKLPPLPEEKRKRVPLYAEELTPSEIEDLALREAERCLNCGGCSECGECVKVCVPSAIQHEDKEHTMELRVGAVILTPGGEIFNPRIKGEYGYGRYPEVITALELERYLSPSGPTGGKVIVPSTGKTPERIAFIQCVGSRDKTLRRDYCSAICCMYTMKEAMLLREEIPSSQVKVFYIDIRAYGKGFERYWKRAKDQYGVQFIPCMISRVYRSPATGRMVLRFLEEGKIKEEEFDLVVLATGISPPPGMRDLAERLGLKLDPYGFPVGKGISPLLTHREGIFVGGIFQEPKDIPESIIQASGCAGEVMELLHPARFSMVEEKRYPPEKKLGEEARIGVFVCHCGKNISSVVEVKKVVEEMGRREGVVHAEDLLFACSPDGLERIKKVVEEKSLNRVVVASCSPRTHEVLFQENIREVGLNPYLLVMANIRDQCSWVHSSTPREATRKAIILSRMAVGKAERLRPLRIYSYPVVQKALIIGGGISGMVSALSLSRQGFGVYLVEKEKELGGNLRYLYRTLEESHLQDYLREIIKEVREDPRIKVFLSSRVKEVRGYAGNFKTFLETDKGEEEIEHGVIIVATGGEEYRPKEYLYREEERVITQRELEKKLYMQDLEEGIKNVVMIQCVGSRDEEHPYCSRICCGEAIKNALWLKEKRKDINVYILYRDIRTYGKKELFYQKALEKGVIFLRYSEERKPQISRTEDGKLQIRLFEENLREEIALEADLVVLSTGIIPHPESGSLSRILKVPLNADGFFLEAHVKLRPVEFSSPGIYLCGLAHSPKYLEETISQAKAVSARASTILSRKFLEVGGRVAVVDREKCAACLTCVRVCPYNVPVIDEEGVAYIEAVKCQGCGTCVGECPARAIQLEQFRDEQILAILEALVEERK